MTSQCTDKNVSTPKLGGGDYADVAQQVHGFKATAYWSASEGGLQIGDHSAHLPAASIRPRFGQLPHFDTPSCVLASSALLTITLLATALPARAAASANPLSILRSE